MYVEESIQTDLGMFEGSAYFLQLYIIILWKRHLDTMENNHEGTSFSSPNEDGQIIITAGFLRDEITTTDTFNGDFSKAHNNLKILKEKDIKLNLNADTLSKSVLWRF